MQLNHTSGEPSVYNDHEHNYHNLGDVSKTDICDGLIEYSCSGEQSVRVRHDTEVSDNNNSIATQENQELVHVIKIESEEMSEDSELVQVFKIKHGSETRTDHYQVDIINSKAEVLSSVTKPAKEQGADTNMEKQDITRVCGEYPYDEQEETVENADNLLKQLPAKTFANLQW